MLKFKIGDTVKVTSGKDKSREGKIESLNVKKRLVVVPGINLYKKHVKGTGKGQKGGIYELPRPLSFSKIALVCPKCKKATRIGFKIIQDKATGSEGLKARSEKVRVCRKCLKEIDLK